MICLACNLPCDTGTGDTSSSKRTDMVNSPNRALIIFSTVTALFFIGVVGYMLLEGYNAVEALYMTVITLTTVGFAEVRPLSDAGRVFTIILLFLGVGTVAYSVGALVEYVLAGKLGGQFASRRMHTALEAMNNHTIICGYGRVGRSAALSLQQNGRPLVIIDKNEDQVATARADGHLVIHGDASKDETLREAGITRANGLIVCAGDDTLNLFVVLSARFLNPDLFIVARSSGMDNQTKMRQAGANRVVSPYQIGGHHIANIMVRPHVTDFFDVVTLDNGQEIWVEELTIEPGSRLVGMSVGEADVRRKTGVTIVAIYRPSTESTFMPDGGTPFAAADRMIVLGTREQLSMLAGWTRPG